MTRPVVVVGAGPTGLTAALELSRFSVPIRLIDRLLVRSTTSRAVAVQARTLELLDQRGVGAGMVSLGNPARAVNLYGDARALGRADLSKIPSRHGYMLMLSQAETERLLEEQVERQGGRVERGVELIAVENRRDPDAGTRVVLRHPDDSLEEVDAAFVVDAEGSHSSLRTTLGLEFAGRTSPQRYALGDLSMDTELPSTEISIFIGRTGFLAVFPLGGRRFRFVATDPSPDARDDPPSLAELQGLYEAVSHVPARMHDLVWCSRFRINSRHLSVLRAGNVFLGGDSAHIHSPAGGQGMNTGIQDMINLCWKVALVHRGVADPGLLDSYSDERLPIIRSVVATTERATDALNSDSGLVHRALTVGASIVLGLDLAMTRGLTMISQTGADYRRSLLSVHRYAAGEVHAGDRIPDTGALLTRPGAEPTSLHQLLDPSGFTLLDLGGAAPPDVAERFRDWPVTVRHLPLSSHPDEATAVFGSDPALVLIRPDAYAAVVTDGRGFDAVIGWLDRWSSRR